MQGTNQDYHSAEINISYIFFSFLSFEGKTNMKARKFEQARKCSLKAILIYVYILGYVMYF